MTSYPRKKKLFDAWAKAMVEGATVDKPSYPGTMKRARKTPMKTTHKRRRRRKHAKKD